MPGEETKKSANDTSWGRGREPTLTELKKGVKLGKQIIVEIFAHPVKGAFIMRRAKYLPNFRQA